MTNANATKLQFPQTSAAHNLPVFPPLEQVTRPTVTTEEAAHYLNRKPQTLRSWASAQPAGVPRPVRINGRLAWKISDIRALLNGEAI
jgi:hypothetical protein